MMRKSIMGRVFLPAGRPGERTKEEDEYFCSLEAVILGRDGEEKVKRIF
ncbi:MAG: hypothetical protein ACOX8F_06780 [Sakamotonia sp.]|jgi:hypothetical protein